MPPKHGSARAFTGIYKLGSTPICTVSLDYRTLRGLEGGTACSGRAEEQREGASGRQAGVLSMFQKGLGGLAESMMQGKLVPKVDGEGKCVVAQGEASVRVNSVVL